MKCLVLPFFLKIFLLTEYFKCLEIKSQNICRILVFFIFKINLKVYVHKPHANTLLPYTLRFSNSEVLYCVDKYFYFISSLQSKVITSCHGYKMSQSYWWLCTLCMYVYYIIFRIDIIILKSILLKNRKSIFEMIRFYFYQFL